MECEAFHIFISMKTSRNKQSQFELFSGKTECPVENTGTGTFTGTPPTARGPATSRRINLMLPLENLIVLGVVIIMSMVVSFSMGVERGKRTEISSRQAPSRAQVPSRVQVQAPSRAQSSEVPKKKVVLTPVFTVAGRGKMTLEKNSDKIYTVQVASFKKEKYAQKEAMNLERKGYEIFVLPKGKHSIVCVGKFAQHDKAKSVSRKLRKRYKDCLIRSL